MGFRQSRPISKRYFAVTQARKRSCCFFVIKIFGWYGDGSDQFVEDQDPEPAIERPREQHTLLLATGQR